MSTNDPYDPSVEQDETTTTGEPQPDETSVEPQPDETSVESETSVEQQSEETSDDERDHIGLTPDERRAAEDASSSET